MPRRLLREPVYAYVAAIGAAAVAVLCVLVALPHEPLSSHLSPAWIAFVAFIVFGELRPLGVPRGDDTATITTSTTFAFALLLQFGTIDAIVGLGVASLVADLKLGKPWWKALFNVAQYTLALAACGTVFQLVSGSAGSDALVFDVRTFGAVAAAAATFFLVNIGVTGVAVALAQRLPVFSFFRHDLVFQASSSAALLAISPIVVVVAEHSLILLPLIGVPMLIAYKSAAGSIEREYEALHDPLTGLPNRKLFFDRLQDALASASRTGKIVGVMIIDLDRFKEVNDTLGHHTGDRLLQQAGPRLQRAIRSSDTVARLGGDEFGVIVPDAAHPAAVQDAAERLVLALRESFTIDSFRLDVDASIGVSFYPGHGTDAETLVQRADVAMYVAKSDQRGIALYDPSVDHYSPSRLAIVSDLRRALETGELELHYQPQLSLRTGEPTAVEALLRWRHHERGDISPAEFIPLAEQTGLMAPLTQFVLTEALTRCARWHALGHNTSVAVNISPRTIHDATFPTEVALALAATGADPSWLNLEITETMLLVDQDRTMQVLHRLAAMGITLSIDDFGTGYSSLAYLKRLPIHEIKIDRSFIIDLDSDESDAVIARSTIELGHNLGIRVVAEGIESATTLTRLAEMGCDLAQGFHVARPMPAHELEQWMAERKAQDARLLAFLQSSDPRATDSDETAA